ncbi:MAG: chorismate mutase [Firmicutes bacterium]|nr:chorismate mutase [Bacillota bacterium]
MESDRRLTLEEARQIINEQDRIIAEAFEKRMAAAREVVRNKMEQGLPIYVPEREEEILKRITSAVPEELSGYAAEVFRKLMEVSRNYQNSLRRFGLLGRTLSHSFSPEIHRMLADYSEPYNYGIFEVEPENLEDFVKHGQWAGLNVTIPYKQDVMAFCDELSPEAERI